MQNRKIDLDDYLNQLKKVFDSVEQYNIEDNIGFRSLKNIGVWLIAYALTAPDEQPTVIKELANLCDPTLTNNLELIINSLSQPDALTTIIHDYEKANGEFAITVQYEQSRKNMLDRARTIGLQELVSKYCKVDPECDADFVFDMNNTIKFNWRGDTPSDTVTLQSGRTAEFGKVGLINYMTTTPETYCEYRLVEFNSRFYHIARISAMQTNKNNKTNNTNVHFIQPVSPDDEVTLQRDYLSILAKATYRSNFADYQAQENLIKRANPANLKISVSGLETIAPNADVARVRVDFSATLHIPKLSGTLKTKEERLGAYEVFRNKIIGHMMTRDIFYLGQRELTYDEKGGEIKNKETFGSQECYRPEPDVKAHYDYTISGPFMLVYSGADTYAFKISDPTKNLEKSFSAKERYQAGAMFSQSISTNIDVEHTATPMLK